MATGDGGLLYRLSNAWQFLVGNVSTTRKFLSQTGSGAASAAPIWEQVTDADLSTSDITTNNVATTKHGFAPKLPNDATKYLDGTGAYTVPAGSGTGTVTNTGTLTDHALIVGNGGVDVSALGSLGTATTVLHGNASADPSFSAVVEADITLADNTTNNVSTSAHGFAPKLPSGIYSPLLGLVAYAAASDSTLHTQASNTMTVMDGTNVTVTFTAPASGNVLVRCSVLIGIPASGDTYLGLIEGVATVATAYALATNAAGVAPAGRVTVTFVLTGVSAGSHTYKLAHRVTANSTSAFTGPNYGQAIMEVWSAP